MGELNPKQKPKIRKVEAEVRKVVVRNHLQKQKKRCNTVVTRKSESLTNTYEKKKVVQ